MEYIKGAEAANRCFLCDVPKAKKDRENLLLCRGKKAFIILNKFPYNCGHLLIAPYSHKPEIEDLSDTETLEFMKLVGKAKKILAKAMKPHGYNLGVNLGRVSGAGLPGHIHFHIVPRWNGDTNFMPVIAETKVLPQALCQTWDLLRKFC